MAELSMLVYPWDIQLDGPEQVVAAVAARGVTRLQIATAYHSAEVLSPRRSTRVAMVAEANRAHLPLPSDAFSDLRVPPSSIAQNDPELYPRLKRAADAAGVALDGWAIAFHNTDLATAHPEAAIENCFGDAFTHGLCPASPAARTYALELLEAVSATELFERVLVESLSYLLVGHGHPHELWGARLDPTTRYLLSLCFCGACVARGQARGVDAERLRAQVAAELHRTWNVEHPAGRRDDTVAELASLHMVWPDLAAYTRMRMDTVTELVVEAAAAVRRHGAKLDVSAAVWGRPAPTNWLEGVDIAATLAASDGFVLESYFPTAGEVAAEIDHTLAIRALSGTERTPLAVALTVWPSFSPTRADFVSKVDAVLGCGVDRLALYNYGTATAPSLEWVRTAAERLGTLR
jgi:hypothetical protein